MTALREVSPLPAAEDRAAVERLEAELLAHPQGDYPLTHHFAPGVYMREIFMPAGSVIVGHEHKTEHYNIVLTGRALVVMNGEQHHITAPCIFKSGAGVRKALVIEEDMRWLTVHPTTETDLGKLETELIIKSATFLENGRIQNQLQQDNK